MAPLPILDRAAKQVSLALILLLFLMLVRRVWRVSRVPSPATQMSSWCVVNVCSRGSAAEQCITAVWQSCLSAHSVSFEMASGDDSCSGLQPKSELSTLSLCVLLFGVLVLLSECLAWLRIREASTSASASSWSFIVDPPCGRHVWLFFCSLGVFLLEEKSSLCSFIMYPLMRAKQGYTRPPILMNVRCQNTCETAGVSS